MKPSRHATDVQVDGRGLEDVLDAVAERVADKIESRVAPLLISPKAPRGLIAAEEAAKLIGVPTSWLETQARRGPERGGFRSYKKGHYRRYDPHEVLEDFKALDSR